MRDVRIRNLPDEVYERWNEAAKAERRTLANYIICAVEDRNKPGNGTGMGQERATTGATSGPEVGKKRAINGPDAPDPRHALVREHILRRHREIFGVACQWDQTESGQLALLLKGNPDWSLGQIANMVDNRFHSEGVTAARPREWLPELGKWAAGRLDRFGKVWRPETTPRADGYVPPKPIQYL
jgi:hypothetical protein